VDFREIKRLVITALFSDDVLLESLVLKGGNALELVYQLVDRGSVDVDFSLEADFDDIGVADERIRRALENRFGAEGYRVFDYKFRPVPPNPKDDWWGGYTVEFKMIDYEGYARLSSNPDRMRIAAHPMAPSGSTVLRIDISKHEYTQGKIEAELDDFVIPVYTPQMIALEKLRAICQQVDETVLPTNKRSRARDFYDIHEILSRREFDLATAENLDLARAIFDARKVPYSMIPRIPESYDLHAGGWAEVRDSIVGHAEEFDFYFEFVVEKAKRLQALWEE
jgi:hypothetical protein